MKQIKFGDILTVEKGLIVHGCNTLGVMNSGLAKQVREKWPACYQAYQDFLSDRRFTDESPLGEIIPFKVNDDLWVINALTQRGFGNDPKKRYVNYEAVQKAFVAIGQFAWAHRQPLQIPYTVHYPQIGAGFGNGDWSLISEIIEVALAPGPFNHTLWIREG